MEKTIRKAILPAGGLGTRFLPATKASPKEMLPIVDKPMIQYAIEEAFTCGIKEFVIITGKYKRAIEDHFDSAFELEESLKKTGKKQLLEAISQLNHLHYSRSRRGGDSPYLSLRLHPLVNKQLPNLFLNCFLQDHMQQ